MKGTIASKKGFYVGDICYVLADKLYHGVWGKNGYKDGEYIDPETGLKFAVAGTAYGDGEYEGSDGVFYGVDAGVIGIVPLELVEKVRGLENGSVHESAGEAEMEAEDGVFKFTFPNGKEIVILTGDMDEDDGDDGLEWWQK